MGAILDRFLSAGVHFEALDGDRLCARGALTDELRASIRESKAAILSELRESKRRPATPAEEACLRSLVPAVCAAINEPDPSEALELALADPEAAIDCFRMLAEVHGIRFAEDADDRRTCRECAEMAAGGRCLAAWRGELPSVASRTYSPAPDQPRRCEYFKPTLGLLS